MSDKIAMVYKGNKTNIQNKTKNILINPSVFFSCLANIGIDWLQLFLVGVRRFEVTYSDRYIMMLIHSKQLVDITFK
jgi:hypothetical protein